MRGKYWLLVAAAMLAPVALSAQSFEGVIHQEVRRVTPQGVQTLAGADAANPEKALDVVASKLAAADPSLVSVQHVTVTIKGTKMRVDGAGGASALSDAYSILDAGTSSLYTVMPQQQRIMVVSGDDFATLRKQFEARGMTVASSAEPTRSALGHEVIDGAQTTGYKLVAPDGVAEVWVDPARAAILAPFLELQKKASIGASSVDAAVSDLGFPLRTRALTKAQPMAGQGWGYTETSVTSIDRQSVSDDLFKLPAAYTRVRLTEMMGGAQ